LSLRLRLGFAPLLLLLFAAGLAVSARAQGFQPVNPDELKIASEAQAPGAPAVILYRQVDRFDTQKLAHENDYFRIKILKEEGRKYANVEIPIFFEGGGGDITNIHARTIEPDGSIVNFEGKAFTKDIVKAKGLKYKAKTFTLPNVQVGSILEYYYTVDLPENFIFESHWILSDELFTERAKFTLLPYTTDYDNTHVRWNWHLLPEGAKAPRQDPDKIIRLEVQNVPAFQTEDFMPPANELKSRVDFTYTDDFETKNADQYWRNYGKKLNHNVESFTGKQKAMEEAVAQIVSPADAPEVKLQKIYDRVQQMRNTSYELRKTEQEQEREKDKESSNVEDVWKKGFGNGGDLNRLFLGLARAAGLEAHAVYASQRSNYFFDPSIMDQNRLDSAFVVVKVNGKDIFCDPGVPFTPFGMLMWPETGTMGRQLDKDGGTWIRTMMTESSDSQTVRKADLTLSETGDLEGKLTVTFTGLEAMQRRLDERHEDDADRKKFLEDEVKEYIPAASEVELTNQPDWKSSTPPLVAEFKLKIPGWGSGAGRRMLLPVGVFGATEQHVFEHAERVHPIYFDFPSQKVDDVTISLPSGWRVGGLPPVQNQDEKAAVYTMKVDIGQGTIHLSRKLEMDLMLVDVKYYPSLRNFFQLVRTGDDEQIVLQPGDTTAVK
jgi:Domain of Unknown Function with PDB structure (DUF3857)/Transglutaminase-like superfamily